MFYNRDLMSMSSAKKQSRSRYLSVYIIIIRDWRSVDLQETLRQVIRLVIPPRVSFCMVVIDLERHVSHVVFALPLHYNFTVHVIYSSSR